MLKAWAKNKELWFVLAAASMTGCGTPATLKDCERIVARVTELELKANDVVDPAAIQKQIAQTQTKFKEKTVKDCVGRRLSKSALACIENASTANEITETCLN